MPSSVQQHWIIIGEAELEWMTDGMKWDVDGPGQMNQREQRRNGTRTGLID
jgi:hypothetical protein